MHTLQKTLSIFLIALVFVGVSSCKDSKYFDPSSQTSSEANALIEVEEDLKNAEQLENTSDEKGSESYCALIEEKIKSFDKESKEMGLAWKLYSYKCGKCAHSEKEKDKCDKGDKTHCKKEDKEKKDDSDYCSNLQLKLKKLKADSKEYLEVQKLIELKCDSKTEKTK